MMRTKLMPSKEDLSGCEVATLKLNIKAIHIAKKNPL
jgi:hypothetical protein